MGLSRRDRAAMTLAIEMARGDDEARRDQIDDFLRSRPWRDVGEFAAYDCQMTRLGLKPWQHPPCWIEPAEIDAVLAEPDDGQLGRHQAAELFEDQLCAD
jgi:hypothetical protein